ncbi:MAG TPA: hypothetical protein VF989_05030 [Polyangiaceae bacterium]
MITPHGCCPSQRGPYTEIVMKSSAGRAIRDSDTFPPEAGASIGLVGIVSASAGRVCMAVARGV